ncbi:MAG: family 78 glycoside hydrolase catalytic domain [Bacteroidota bacterium]|nr:family 78 glycoside hydrolase catalytic domain [Bacteroidota bacterium]
MLDGVQPEASWIWDSGEINPYNYYLHVRKSFELDNSPIEARAFISAHAFAELYINGAYVDRVPTNPDPEYQTYEEIDLVPYLQKGTNTIAALVYNPGKGLHHRMDARGGFFFQAGVSDKTGKVTEVHSDKSWHVAQALAWDTSTKKRQNDFTIGMRERYDARLAYVDWQEPSFDDSNWESAKVIGVPPVEPWNQIVVVKRERLLYEILEPVSEWNAKGYKVYDFGREITAYPHFTLTAKRAGVEMILGTGERLDNDSVPRMKDNVNYTDTYITREGSQSWHPLTWRGFRYMAIKENPDVTIDNVSGEFRSFPVRREGSFTCSDKELNQIWETGRWTMQLCAHDTWMDTPWREQTQYISGDTRYNIQYSVYAFAPNIKLLHDYNILSGAFSQRHSEEGAIRSRYPTGAHLGPTTSTYIPDYQLEWILMLHEYYMFYHDAGLIKQVYPNLKKLLQYFEGYVSAERGLVGKVPGWVVLDHPDTYKQDVDGENTAVNCLYYGALNSASWMARCIMEDKQKAIEWEQKAQAVKNSIQKYLWSEKDNAFKDGYESSRITQQTQVYALKYGLVPEDKKAPVVEFTTSQGRSCEQSFSYWLLNTMFAEGEGQWALDYIRTYWGKQMKKEDFNGAWYEMWESPLGMTKSHAWCSGPTALLPEIVLGVAPIQPGWKQFSIQPSLYDLEWAEGVVPSVAGDIQVKLKRLMKGGVETGLQIEAVVPERTSAMIHVPVQSSEHFAIHVNDKLIWQDGKLNGSSKNISYISESDRSIVFEFQAGNYVINASSKLK